MLTVPLGLAGFLAYVFFAVASHNLTRDEYGQIVVLWSVSFLVISTFFRTANVALVRRQ